MYMFGVLSLLLAIASAEVCYKDVLTACSSKPSSNEENLISNCNAKYGSIETYEPELQGFANANIQSSFKYLLMSTFFGNYIANREGFKGLYRKYSDNMWEDAIDVIKYITKRGGEMNFGQQPRFKASASDNTWDLNEIHSLAKALDIQKQIANEALHIHFMTQHHKKPDSAVAHYLEEHFMEKHSDQIRELAGHTNDLQKLLSGGDSSVAVFLFDEFLKKSS